MNFSSHRASALQPSLIREVAESAMGRADVIGLWFGEGRWPTSEIAVSAAQNALAKGDHFYQPNSGKPALRASLQNYMNRLYGLALDISAITVTGSGMQAMMLAAQALTDPGDKIVVVGPAWPNLAESFKIAGGDIHIVSLQAVNGRWHLDMDRLIDSLTPDTKAVLVNSPNNPTGWVMDKADQLQLLFHCRKHGIWIISDDVYSRLYQFADAAPNMMSCGHPEDRIISVNSFSKAWSMTGWRLGWLAGPPELEPVFAQLTEYNMSCSSGFVQEAGKAMIEQGEGEVRQLQERLAQSYQLIKTRLQAIEDVEFIDPDGAFYSFFSIDGLTNSVGFCKALIQTAGVGLAPGLAFGAQAEGYVRLCYAQDIALLEEAFDRFEKGYRQAIKSSH